jgi:hypothetical protein
MDSASAVGAALTRIHACIVCVLLAARPLAAADRYAVVVTGASGGAPYAGKYEAWRASLVAMLEQKLGYPSDHIVVLAEQAAPPARRATRDEVRAAFQDLVKRVAKDDVVFVMLIGHGTSGDEGARFNLVGPDLTAAEWAALVKPIAGRVVFVNGGSGSFEFLEALAGRGRVVVTAADSAAQQYETVFPEFFIAAFGEEQADLDRNGRISIWEAFQTASSRVKKWFEDQGRLATERPLLDDNGDGIGREADDGPEVTKVRDGALAQATFLQRDAPAAAGTDAGLAALLRDRADVQSRIDRLRAGKADIPPDQYERDLEALLVELARLERQIRSKS